MSELISGKEALIAMANGEDVEYMDTSNTFKSLGWGDAFGLETNLFFSDRFKFRLKPRTITLNGVEVPAPFEPKEGDYYWFMDVNNRRGYDHDQWGLDHINDENWSFYGAWRTEEEIKQVVAALRSIFGKK